MSSILNEGRYLSTQDTMPEHTWRRATAYSKREYGTFNFGEKGTKLYKLGDFGRYWTTAGSGIAVLGTWVWE